MKTKFLFVITLLILSFQGCDSESDLVTVNVATPKYMALEDFKKSVEITMPAPIIESGKIYVYKNLVLVNDIDQGIHIIDNSDPENPHKIAFIKIPANKDMEIKGDYLYADSLMDLLVFDISDINAIKEMKRLENVFPQYVPLPFAEDLIIDYGNHSYNPDEIMVGWTLTEERMTQEELDKLNGGFFTDDILMMEANTADVGQGGSLARFKIVEDYLYAVDSHNINIFNIEDLENPQQGNAVFAGFDIETIFNRDNFLFLGSMRGMYVYDITTAASPKFISEFQHGTACDPVVVDDHYAYITLRAGNTCGAIDSSLQIVDISNISAPVLTKSYEMDGPYGLGIKDDLLFICDGDSGLKVYDKTNVEELQLLDHFEDITTYDVIPMDNHLLMIGDKILYQYNYSENGLSPLSTLSLN